MTQDEFLEKYHDYMTENLGDATAEAARANAQGIEDDVAVVVDMGEAGYCLMLISAVTALRGVKDD